MAKIKTGPKVKRKGGGVPAKSRAVDALADQLSGSTALVVTEYRGLKVTELQDLRKRLRPRGVEYHVVKNSLLSHAASKTQREELRSLLSGPTAIAMSNGDEVDLAKGLIDETKALKALRILGGLLGGKAVSADQITALSKLPGRPQLQAEIVGSLQAPLGQIVGVLGAPFQQLVHVFGARGSSS
jgi:large subunit ribosomal protein L10